MNPNAYDYTAQSNEQLADDLGSVRAAIASLQAEAKRIEAILKDRHVVATDGNRYRVTISYDVARKVIDWKSIASRFEPSRQLIQAHTRLSIGDRVQVKARLKTP